MLASSSYTHAYIAFFSTVCYYLVHTGYRKRKQKTFLFCLSFDQYYTSLYIFMKKFIYTWNNFISAMKSICLSFDHEEYVDKINVQ